MGSKTVGDSALKLLRTYPRVSLGNIKNLPGSLHKVSKLGFCSQVVCIENYFRIFKWVGYSVVLQCRT